MDPQVVETPLDQWLQDIETILSSAVSNSLGLIKNEKTPQTVLTSTIPSGQNQIPVGDRIAKVRLLGGMFSLLKKFFFI